MLICRTLLFSNTWNGTVIINWDDNDSVFSWLWSCVYSMYCVSIKYNYNYLLWDRRIDIQYMYSLYAKMICLYKSLLLNVKFFIYNPVWILQHLCVCDFTWFNGISHCNNSITLLTNTAKCTQSLHIPVLTIV